MNLQLVRYSLGPVSSLGFLLIDGQFACYTLEDTSRDSKIPGKTCIPAGRYFLNLRTEGSQHQQYAQKFPAFHKGMLHLLDVPNFKYIHIHIGNTQKDTDGCILLGDGAERNQVGDGMITHSTQAYKRVYPKIAQAIERGEEVSISIHNAMGIPEMPGQEPNAQVIANRLNLRKQPGGSIAGILAEGTQTQILDRTEGWNKIKIVGWVAEEYLL